jgi:hypothetical protein
VLGGRRLGLDRYISQKPNRFNINYTETKPLKISSQSVSPTLQRNEQAC